MLSFVGWIDSCVIGSSGSIAGRPGRRARTSPTRRGDGGPTCRRSLQASDVATSGVAGATDAPGRRRGRDRLTGGASCCSRTTRDDRDDDRRRRRDGHERPRVRRTPLAEPRHHARTELGRRLAGRGLGRDAIDRVVNCGAFGRSIHVSPRHRSTRAAGTWSFTRRLASATRHFTVPSGTSRIAAISSYVCSPDAASSSVSLQLRRQPRDRRRARAGPGRGHGDALGIGAVAGEPVDRIDSSSPAATRRAHRVHQAAAAGAGRAPCARRSSAARCGTSRRRGSRRASARPRRTRPAPRPRRLRACRARPAPCGTRRARGARPGRRTPRGRPRAPPRPAPAPAATPGPRPVGVVAGSGDERHEVGDGDRHWGSRHSSSTRLVGIRHGTGHCQCNLGPETLDFTRRIDSRHAQ